MITDEDYFMILYKFKSKRSATYDFIVRAGLKFQLAILKLCRRLIKNETFPTRFNLTTLIQLPKKDLPKNWKIKDLSISRIGSPD